MDGDDDVNPQYGAAALSVADASCTFASASSELGHFFYAYTWYDQANDAYIATIVVVLNSIPIDHYTFTIDNDGMSILVNCRIPRVFLVPN